MRRRSSWLALGLAMLAQSLGAVHATGFGRSESASKSNFRSGLLLRMNAQSSSFSDPAMRGNRIFAKQV